jgi:hypothetical protein
VVDQPLAGAAAGDPVLERRADQHAAHVRGHRPADAAAREAVDDGGQVQRALAGLDPLDVGEPEPVRPARAELAADEIGADRTP